MPAALIGREFMKRSLRFVPLVSLTAALFAAALSPVLEAAPLRRAQVAADARWVLHLDLDSFRATQVGDSIVKGRLERDMNRIRADLKTYLGFDFDWTQIGGLTAYGVDFETRRHPAGVLLLETSLDVRSALETAVAKQAEAGVDGNVQRVEGAAVPTYQIRREFFVAVPPGKPVVLAKKRDLLDKGLAVLEGRVANLASSQAFLGFPATPPSFVFLGMAEGFADNAAQLPQARVFKNAEAGQVILGEVGSRVFLTVNLRARSAEAAAQMQQVTQGLLALGSLNQSDNRDLMTLIQATKVTVNDAVVTLTVELPVPTIVQKIQDKLRQESGR